MSDYYTPAQLAQRVRVSEAEIRNLQQKGLLQATVKNGKTFYSSQQAYRLQAAVRWAKRDSVQLEKALSQVEDLWLATTRHETAE